MFHTCIVNLIVCQIHLAKNIPGIYTGLGGGGCEGLAVSREDGASGGGGGDAEGVGELEGMHVHRV